MAQLENSVAALNKDLAAVSKLVEKAEIVKKEMAEELAGLARQRLRQEFLTAEMGITGANFLVADTGMGIPPEILPQIFDPFFSTKETATASTAASAQAMSSSPPRLAGFVSAMRMSYLVRGSPGNFSNSIW